MHLIMMVPFRVCDHVLLLVCLVPRPQSTCRGKALCAKGTLVEPHQLLSLSGTLHQLGVDEQDGMDPSPGSSVVEKPALQ